jgi:hypothetical protein
MIRINLRSSTLNIALLLAGLVATLVYYARNPRDNTIGKH